MRDRRGHEHDVVGAGTEHVGGEPAGGEVDRVPGVHTALGGGLGPRRVDDHVRQVRVRVRTELVLVRSGRAGGVEVQLAVPGRCPGDHQRGQGRALLLQAAEHLGVVEPAELPGGDGGDRTGVAQHVADLALPVHRHDRHHHRADPGDRQVGDDELGPVGQLDGDPVAGAHPASQQRGPEAVGACPDGRVVHLGRAVGDEPARRGRVRPAVEQRGHGAVTPPAVLPEPRDRPGPVPRLGREGRGLRRDHVDLRSAAAARCDLRL